MPQLDLFGRKIGAVPADLEWDYEHPFYVCTMGLGEPGKPGDYSDEKILWNNLSNCGVEHILSRISLEMEESEADWYPFGVRFGPNPSLYSIQKMFPRIPKQSFPIHFRISDKEYGRWKAIDSYPIAEGNVVQDCEDRWKYWKPLNKMELHKIPPRIILGDSDERNEQWKSARRLRHVYAYFAITIKDLKLHLSSDNFTINVHNCMELQASVKQKNIITRETVNWWKNKLLVPPKQQSGDFEVMMAASATVMPPFFVQIIKERTDVPSAIVK